jgi:molybdenum cofactor sulfurtransferase
MANVTGSDLQQAETHITARIDSETGYITNIDAIRETEYPQLKATTYLDHAGTTLYARSLIEKYSRDLTSNLFGNPHSASSASQLSSTRIDDARLQVLRFFQADPAEFDVIFVANATAAIKIIADAFRDIEGGFEYFYHAEAHTSLVGVRELATRGTTCFGSDQEVEAWLNAVEHIDPVSQERYSLFAYPAQSNMTGRRLPLTWPQRIAAAQESTGHRIYTLLDAAALVSTTSLDLSHPSTSPDFTALSFYKIFGFPDLGALIVRKSASDILQRRRYFGGGTVESVTTTAKDPWHAKKGSLHAALEDGTVAFHSILALQSALAVHAHLYGSMKNISRHANYLAESLRSQLRALRHASGGLVCTIYNDDSFTTSVQGPVIAFNLRDSRGTYVSNAEVEKLAIVKSIQFRTGGLCNPGGIASHLKLSPDDLRQNYEQGHRCGNDNDLINGKPTGAIRLSFGAMSSKKDVDIFMNFIKEFYVDSSPTQPTQPMPASLPRSFVVEALSVFPIKSCAAYKIPRGLAWEVGPKGLAWDREWCLVHEGTNVALSQKRFPRMALLRPEIDPRRQILRITFGATDSTVLEVGLNSECTRTERIKTCKPANVCGEDVVVDIYNDPEVVNFFTSALEVPCTLARFPNDGTIRQASVRVPGNSLGQSAIRTGRSIALSNESPILLVSRSSVNRLNEQIKQRVSGAGKAVTADSFRGNILIAEELAGGEAERPYVEDEWTGVQIGDGPESLFEVLGPCQRCQMVCVDQKSAQRRQEPFSTLAKTRRRDGRVWFGMHMCLASDPEPSLRHLGTQGVSIKVGDKVTPLTVDD